MKKCILCSKAVKYANDFGKGYCEECASELLSHSDKYGCMVDENGGLYHLTLGGFVRDKRLHLGMTQKEFARVSGIAEPSLSNIENGKRVGLNIQKKLAKYFGMTPGQIRELQW